MHPGDDDRGTSHQYRNPEGLPAPKHKGVPLELRIDFDSVEDVQTVAKSADDRARTEKKNSSSKLTNERLAADQSHLRSC